MVKRGLVLVLPLIILAMAGCGGGKAQLTDEIAVQAESGAVSPRDAEQLPVDGPPSNALNYEDTVASITPERSGKAREHQRDYPDTVGWLMIPGTDIDNAVVQSDDMTNEYYLNHDLDGNPDRNGVYSAHSGCMLRPGTREGISANTTIFAHNHDDDPDGILFAQLKKYKDEAFARRHPYLFFSTAQEDMAWEVFAVYDTVKTIPYIAPEAPWPQWRRILDSAQGASLYDYGIEVAKEDHILTLSTCTFDVPGVGRLPITEQNDYRFVVMARLVSPDEQFKESASFIPNAGALLPEEFPVEDVFYWNEKAYILVDWYLQSPCVAPVNHTNLVQTAEVLRTGITEGLEQGDASCLPVGTALYADPEYPDMLLLSLDGEWYPYVPYSIESPAHSVRLILEQDGEILGEREVDGMVGNVFWPICGMGDGTRMKTGESIRPRADSPTIYYESRDSICTIRLPFYLGTPESIGEEVLIKQQVDGFFYKDAALFHTLLDLFDESS